MNKSMDAVYLNSMDYQLLQILLTSGPIKLEDLASHGRVSTRTMQKYLHTFSEHLGDIAEIRMSFDGYFLHIRDYQRFSNLQSGALKQHIDINDQLKRQADIFLKLVRARDDFVVTDELAEEYLISRNTLLKDIKNIRGCLADYHIDIIGVTSRGIKLEVTSNTDLVMAIYNYAFDYARGYFPLPTDLEAEITSDLIALGAKEEARQIFTKIIRIVAFIKRLGLTVDGINPQYQNFVKSNEVITGLIKKVEANYGLIFTTVERDFLMFPFNLYASDLLDKEKLAIQIDKNEVLFNHIAVEVQDLVATKIDYNLFYQQIRYHLVFLIQRAIFHISPSDYMTDKMLQRFQLAADLAMILVEKLSKSLAIVINDVEVNYLAVYFELTLKQEQGIPEKTFQVGFLSSMGTSIKQYLQNQLNNIFESNVEIISFDSEHDIRAVQKNMLMLFTDRPVASSFDMPVIKIGDIFRDRSLELKVKASMVNNAIEEGHIIWDISKIAAKKCIDYETVLKDVTQSDISKGIVGPAFTNDLIKHERTSSFVLENGVVMPHVVATTRDDCILLHMCTLEKPVQVRNSKVSIIFILGIPRVLSQQAVQTLGVIYDLLFLIAVNDSAIMNLTKIQDAEKMLIEVMEGL